MKKEHSIEMPNIEMPDTEISRWQAFDAGKHKASPRSPRLLLLKLLVDMSGYI